MNKLTQLIRSDLLEFNPYLSARDEKIQGNIWLNANESPFDFELNERVKINRYPEKQPPKLIKKLSDIFNVGINQIAISRGSDEMIDLLIRLFCVSGKDAVMTCIPTYSMYAVYAQLQGARVIEVPLLKNKNFQIDLSSILSRSNESVKIIFLCSPNNPTGNLLSKETILDLCEKFSGKSIIVVDEAYIDYADAVSLSESINQYENLVVLRTMSKAYGLAGARFGLLLANENIIKWVLKIIAPYPLSSLITDLVFNFLSATRVLEIQKEIECVKSERVRVLNALKLMPFVKQVWQSEANFVLIETDIARKILAICSKNGIALRSMFEKIGLENGIRISIGLPDENTRLIKVLTGIR